MTNFKFCFILFFLFAYFSAYSQCDLTNVCDYDEYPSDCGTSENPDECDNTYPCEESGNLCPQLSCANPIQIGHVFKPNKCRSDMEGILNRSARFAGLNEFRVNNDSRYCDQIQLAVDLNIGLIKSPATHWGTHDHIWWENMCNMVCDINKAYDCAAQRRPILEFMNLEVVDSGVCWYNICDEIKDVFADEIEEACGMNNPYPHDNFDIHRIWYEDAEKNEYTECKGANYCGIPDISRLEARMYMFYLAKRYIDCGYRSMNLADVGRYTKNDPNLCYLEDFINKVSTYSELKGYKLTICGGPEILKIGNNFLFDYLELPYRTEEPANMEEPMNYFPEGSPCGDDPLQAYLPEEPIPGCDIPNVNLTGISPDGCEGTLPVLYKFDNYSGVVIPGGESSTSCYHTYGMDEATWWKNLSPECQIQFFEHYYCNQNDLDKKRYFEIPAMITPDSQLPDSLREKWLLTEHPELYDVITAIAEPELMQPTFIKSCDLGNGIFCNVKKGWEIVNGKKCYVFKGKEKYKTQFKLSINNPDCSSTYGWSAQNPDGTWIGYHEGEQLNFTPTQTGTYRLIARQYNSALENGFHLIDTFIDVDDLICCDEEFKIINIFCPCLKLQSNMVSEMLSVDVVNIEDAADNNFSIQILNSFGSTVKTVNNIPLSTQNFQVDISNLDNGVHYLQTDLCNELNLEFVKF